MTGLEFGWSVPAWVLGLVVAPAILLLAWWAYRLPLGSKRAARAAFALRALLLGFGVFLLLGPYLRRDQTRTEKAPLVLLYDDSASMQTQDHGGQGTRLEQLRALAGGDFVDTLGERYDLRAWRFSERLNAAQPGAGGLEGKGQGTALGDALLAVLAEYRGRSVPDVVLFSDGRSNLGAPVSDAVERVAAEGVGVHVVAFGRADEAPDLALERVQVPDVVLSGDVGVFSLRVRATGTNVPRRAVVRLLDEEGEELDRVEAGQPDEAGVQVVLSARLRDAGERLLVAEVEAAPGETATDNNRLELALDVKDARVRVLYVDGKARWEYRYLWSRLVRAERDVAAQIWLADAGRRFPQESSRDLPPLRTLPVSEQELLDRYDVVIIGDVDPTEMTTDPLDGRRFLDAVAAFVRRGGGLLMLAGPRHNPDAYVGTPIEALLPVVLGNEPPPPKDRFRPLPADPARPHPVTIFDSDPQRNLALWEDAAPLWWFRPVERLRPGAQPWLVHSEEGNEYGPYVIAASAYTPEGWVGWIGTDETWRWRFPGGEVYPSRFWRAALRHVAATRLRGDRGRARLDLDRSVVELGEFLQVEARLLDDAYRPVSREAGVDVFREGSDEALTLAPVPDEPGIFRGRLRPTAVGPAKLHLPPGGDPGRAPLASARYTVVLPSRETADTSQDRAALRALADAGNGRLVNAAEASRLLSTLDGSERVVKVLSSRQENLDPRLLLGIFLTLGAAEWILRKTLHLS